MCYKIVMLSSKEQLATVIKSIILIGWIYLFNYCIIEIFNTLF